MTTKNPVRFYRVGATRLSLVPVGRSGNLGFRSDESWSPVSSVFNDPGQAGGVYQDQYTDTYLAPTNDTTAMRYVQTVWQANTGDSDADLQKKIHAALNGAGYKTLGGAVIT